MDFRPLRTGTQNRDLAGDSGEHLPVAVQQQPLDAGGADIEAEEDARQSSALQVRDRLGKGVRWLIVQRHQPGTGLLEMLAQQLHRLIG